MSRNSEEALMVLAEKYLPRYTYEDYANWEGDWELIEGVPYAMAPSPLKRHQFLSGLIFKLIYEQLESCSQNCQIFQDVDWIVNNSTVVRPDLLAVCDDEAEDYVRKTPEVVFEIVSPASAIKDENLKFLLYQQEGVNYYVLVYPEGQRIKVYKLMEGRFIKVFDDTKGSFMLEIRCPFEVRLDELWKRME